MLPANASPACHNCMLPSPPVNRFAFVNIKFPARAFILFPKNIMCRSLYLETAPYQSIKGSQQRGQCLQWSETPACKVLAVFSLCGTGCTQTQLSFSSSLSLHSSIRPSIYGTVKSIKFYIISIALNHRSSPPPPNLAPPEGQKNSLN